MEILRTSRTIDGQFISIEFSNDVYTVGTRWCILSKHTKIQEAIGFFEVLEFCEGDLPRLIPTLRKEMKRARGKIIGGAMSLTWHVLDCMEKRVQGLHPYYCGSKGSVIVWK